MARCSDGNHAGRHHAGRCAGRARIRHRAARVRPRDLRDPEDSGVRPRGGRRGSGRGLHRAAARQGPGAPADRGCRLRLHDGSEGRSENHAQAGAVRQRARHARAALLQCAVHRLRRRPQGVRRPRGEGLPAEGPVRRLRGRIPAGRLCVPDAARAAPRPQAGREGAQEELAAAAERAHELPARRAPAPAPKP